MFYIRSSAGAAGGSGKEMTPAEPIGGVYRKRRQKPRRGPKMTTKADK
jgi:hypothetical protein